MVLCAEECWQWTGKYFGECVCSEKDTWSFGFGMLSIVAWAFAEVPQIVQNFATGHSEGMSIFFVLIWLTGDALNIIGCLLARAVRHSGPSQTHPQTERIFLSC